MSTNIRIVHAYDFIKATPEGKLDLQKSKEYLMDIVSASTTLVDYEVIIDTRKTQTAMSITDLWYLAAEVANLFKTFPRKIAVLCPLEHFDQAGFFALCAQNRGVRVQAFTSFEDAIEWLIAKDV